MGVSFDHPALNAAWAIAQNYQYQLWSDLDRILAMAYGAANNAGQGAPSRVSVLLDRDGSVILEYRQVSPNSHPQQVLEDCQLLFEGR